MSRPAVLLLVFAVLCVLVACLVLVMSHRTSTTTCNTLPITGRVVCVTRNAP